MNHFDTGHAHAHIVVRGVDRDGLELRFDRDYISRGVRWRAQEIATEELGPRLEHEIQRSRVNEVTQERWTSLDRMLERCANGGQVEAKELRRAAPDEKSLLTGRLEQLEAMRLAERISPSAWVLADGWQRDLRELGTRGDIIKEMHADLRVDISKLHVIDRELPESGIWGRVAKKGLADELKGTFYAIIETPNGEGYRLPIGRKAADTLRVGDVVSVATERDDPKRPRLRVEPDRPLKEQAGHRGHVSLDRVDERTLGSSGFGAEVKRALEERREMSRAAGVHLSRLGPKDDGPDRGFTKGRDR